MNLVAIESLADPRVGVYANMRDAELAQRADPLDASAHAGLFIAEGELVVSRLVRSRFAVHSVLSTPQRLSSLGPTLDGLPADVPVYLAPQPVMNEIVGFNMHRGVLAVGIRAPEPTLTDIASRGGPLLILEDLVNHDNLGSIFRNAAALGGPGIGVVLSPRCADPLYRKSLRVSMGLVLDAPFTRVREWPGAVHTLHEHGFETWALTPGAGAIDISAAAEAAAKAGRPVALLLGSEGPGLTEAAFAAASRRVRIPMRPTSGLVDSLNVGVAAGIALYALGQVMPPGIDRPGKG